MTMFNKVTKSFQFGDHNVTLTTGEIARQATGAVVCAMDDTVVLATVVAKKEAKPGQDFFPLTTSKRPTPPVSSPAGSSSVKAARAKRKRSRAASLTARSVRFSRTASLTKCRSSFTFCLLIRKSIPTFLP